MTQRSKKSQQSKWRRRNSILESPVNPEYQMFSNCKNKTPIHSRRQSLESGSQITKYNGQREKLLHQIRLDTNSNNGSEQYPDAEKILLKENSHLKEHNNYLRGQITKMFEREKAFKKTLSNNTQTIKKFESVNQQLLNQIHYLSHTLFEEIQRLQAKLLSNASCLQGEELVSYSSSSSLDSKISNCFDQTLTNLKQKINTILTEKNCGKFDHYRELSEIPPENVFKKDKNKNDEDNTNNETSVMSASLEMYLNSLSSSIRKKKVEDNKSKSLYGSNNLYKGSGLKGQKIRMQRLNTFGQCVDHHNE